MIALFNYYFSENTKIIKACTKIPGIGKKMGEQALDRAGITSSTPIGKVTNLQLSKVKEIIGQSYDIDHELRALLKQKIKRLSAISCYRGFRHYRGLPCRGQRTHSNAKTCRKLRVKGK